MRPIFPKNGVTHYNRVFHWKPVKGVTYDNEEKQYARRRSRPGPYTSDFKLRAIKLHLEEGYPIRTLAEELGIGKSTLSKWKRRYLEEGESGLINRWPGAQNPSKPRINPAIKQKAVELKKEDPKRGSRRISDMLRRFHLMKASPETVRKTLKEEGGG